MAKYDGFCSPYKGQIPRLITSHNFYWPIEVCPSTNVRKNFLLTKFCQILKWSCCYSKYHTWIH